MSTTETERVARGTPDPARHRAFFMRLHFYAGLLVGPFILIAAITGGLYAVAPTIEQWVYRDQLSAASTDEALPLSDQVRAAQAERPDLIVSAVRPASAGEATRVMFDDPTLGPSERRAVFIDPSTARPQGELVVYGSSGALPLRTWIDQLHRSLHLGEPGRIYSELAASWLWMIALGGLFLWVSRYRRMKATGSKGAHLLLPDLEARGRRRMLNWHGVTGMWIAVGLVFLSATGLTWSTYTGAHVDELRVALSWTTPAVSKTLPDPSAGTIDGGDGGHGNHGDHGEHGTGASSGPTAGHGPRVDEVDRAVDAARAAGVDGKVEVSIPAKPNTAFVVAQTRQPWVMSNDSVAVDGATGAITDASWFADWPLAAKLAAWGIQLHMGLLFGPANQLVLLALAAALATVVVRGYVMWWRRRPARGGFGGRPPLRGVLAALPIGTAAAVVAAAGAIGWFIPLLGISLAAFVAIDVLIGWWQRRRPSKKPIELQDSTSA